jgi:type VI secretion system secreted protein VgrG
VGDSESYTQANRLIAIDTPLGKDVLLLQSLSGHEEISRLFSFELEVLAHDNDSISFKNMVGQNVTLTIQLPNGTSRYLNGYVSRFAQGATDERFFTHYTAQVVPWLWFLTRQADCRIFQNMSVPDIISQVFGLFSLAKFRNSLNAAYPKLEYCVQYRETAFNFVSRLMEEHGIFYYFDHTKQGEHTLVLADSSSALTACSSSPASYDVTPGGLADPSAVTAWYIEQELRTGKYTVTDYNFTTPSTSLLAQEPTVVSVSPNQGLEIFDYPGLHTTKDQGETVAKVRMQEEEADYMVATGPSNCRGFASGYTFELRNHDRADQDTTYILTEVQHVASAGDTYIAGTEGTETYSNHFTCIPSSVTYRPRRVTPKPFVQGPQPALVVGKSGEEIWTDKYGRVKVQFYWDRLGKKDENSSCWVRVSHPWAGQGWGSVSIPRIGQEVIVEFLEGDPDRPIIMGRVYNAEQMPPYGLPGSQVVSGLKTNSTKGGGGYNEMSMDDTKGKEKITIHAQYDMGTTVEHDDTQTVHNNRKIDVEGTHTETIVKDTTIQVTEGNFVHQVQTGKASYYVKDDIAEVYDATQVTVVKKSIDMASSQSYVHVYADKDEIMLKSGLSSIVMKKDGTIEISGKNITITGSDMVKSQVPPQSVTCNPQMVSVQGAKINSTAVGMHEISGALIKIN